MRSRHACAPCVRPWGRTSRCASTSTAASRADWAEDVLAAAGRLSTSSTPSSPSHPTAGCGGPGAAALDGQRCPSPPTSRCETWERLGCCSTRVRSMRWWSSRPASAACARRAAIVELATAAGGAGDGLDAVRDGRGPGRSAAPGRHGPGPQAHGLATAELLESDLLQTPLAIAGGRMTVPAGASVWGSSWTPPPSSGIASDDPTRARSAAGARGPRRRTPLRSRPASATWSGRSCWRRLTGSPWPSRARAWRRAAVSPACCERRCSGGGAHPRGPPPGRRARAAQPPGRVPLSCARSSRRLAADILIYDRANADLARGSAARGRGRSPYRGPPGGRSLWPDASAARARSTSMRRPPSSSPRAPRGSPRARC